MSAVKRPMLGAMTVKLKLNLMVEEAGKAFYLMCA